MDAKKKKTCKELLFKSNCLGNNLVDSVSMRVSLQMRKEQASKNSVHTLIATDKLVRECETQHEATPFEPED